MSETNVGRYSSILHDTGRVQAYAEALRRTITPGAVVADMASGIGVFALLACQSGARRVYAIESSGAIQFAREFAARHGCADRIVFYPNASFNVVLPELADVLLAVQRSTLPLNYAHLNGVIDARRRFLKPGGTLIGQQDTLWVAGVEAPAIYQRSLAPWPETLLGVDLRPAQEAALYEKHTEYFEAEHVLLEPQRWGDIDYRTVTSSDMRGELTWRATRNGMLHGIAVWVDTLLVEGIGFSNAPGQGYRQRFFPLLQPVAVEQGDLVTVKLWASLLGQKYTWTWNTRVVAGSGQGAIKAEFRQSTFQHRLDLSARAFPQQETPPAAGLNEDGLITRFLLDFFATGVPLDEVAILLARRYPARFPDPAAARGYIDEVVGRFTR